MATKLVRCKQGHVFDSDQSSACPRCGEFVGKTDGVSQDSIVPPDPQPTPRTGYLKQLFRFPLNAAAAGGAILMAGLAWYVTSPTRVGNEDVCANPSTTPEGDKTCRQAKAEAVEKAPPENVAAPAQTAAAEAPAASATSPNRASIEVPPSSQNKSKDVATQLPAAAPKDAQAPAQIEEPHPPPKDPSPAESTGLDPSEGARFLADKTPAQRPTHTVVLEQSPTDFAIGMRGKSGVVAALVCEDPRNDTFGGGAISVWMAATGWNTKLQDQQSTPKITVDGLEIVSDIELRIDGQTFSPTNRRVLTVKNGHRLVGDIAASEALFGAMASAKRVEIVGDSSVLMVETGGRFDELAKIVDGCKRIAGVSPVAVANARPDHQPSPATSDPAVNVATIVALEDKYAFTTLTRELLATSQGAFAYDRKDYDAAKAWFELGIVKDNPAANFYRAQMAETGNGAPQDYAMALRLFAESANGGFYWAQLRLGKIYSTGGLPGVAADPAKAKPWLMMAAKEDRGEANRMLAEMGVPKNEIKPTRNDLETALGQSYQAAFDIAKTLVAQGSAGANFWVGSLMHDGQGAERDPAAARDFIIKGARAYDAPSIVTVAQWSFDGEGTSKNATEAVTLAYIARENAVFGADTSMIDKRTSAFLDKITNEQYEDVRQMLKGIRDIPARPQSN